MRTSRRVFLKRTTALLAAMPLAGCLGQDSGEASAAPANDAPTSTSAPAAPAAQPAPATQPQPGNQPAPTPAPQNSGPVWQPSPTVEFVEGVPATISVRDFVRDPENDPLVIALSSGTLIPGLTWNPANSTIAYDGRPLGAREETPVVVTGIVFTADDRRL